MNIDIFELMATTIAQETQKTTDEVWAAINKEARNTVKVTNGDIENIRKMIVFETFTLCASTDLPMC